MGGMGGDKAMDLTSWLGSWLGVVLGTVGVSDQQSECIVVGISAHYSVAHLFRTEAI